MSAAPRPTLACRMFARQYGLPVEMFLDRLRLLEESQYWPADRLAALQAADLEASLTCAASRVEHYRRIFERLRCAPAEIARQGRLDTLPVLERADLEQIFDEASRRPLAEGVRVMSSSGSSGRPARTLQDRAARCSNQATRGRTLSWYGVRPWERQGLIVGQRPTTRERLFSFCVDRLARRRRNGTFGMEREDAIATARRFIRFGPAYLLGMPSLLNRLAHFATEAGLDLRAARVRAILFNSEVLIPTVARRVTQAFGSAATDEYGCTEVGSIAHRCPEGTLHLNPEHAIVELLDERGTAVPPGVPGRVVLTTLQNRVLPLIRYAVGDVAVRAARPCPCGRQPGGCGLQQVEGRQRYAWRDAKGALIAVQPAVFAALELLDRAAFLEGQIVQVGAEEVEIRTLPAAPCSAALLEAVRRVLSEKLGADVRVRSNARAVERAPSGKLAAYYRDSGGAAR